MISLFVRVSVRAPANCLKFRGSGGGAATGDRRDRSLRNSETNVLTKICDRVLEDAEAIAGGFGFAAGPPRMLGGIDVALRVRHEAENVARRIADARYVAIGAVGIVG